MIHKLLELHRRHLGTRQVQQDEDPLSTVTVGDDQKATETVVGKDQADVAGQ